MGKLRVDRIELKGNEEEAAGRGRRVGPQGLTPAVYFILGLNIIERDISVFGVWPSLSIYTVWELITFFPPTF